MTTGLPWDHPYWADRITPRETPETLEALGNESSDPEVTLTWLFTTRD